jgi:hypothetical protein
MSKTQKAGRFGRVDDAQENKKAIVMTYTRPGDAGEDDDTYHTVVYTATGNVKTLVASICGVLSSPAYVRDAIKPILEKAKIGDTFLIFGIGSAEPGATVTVVAPDSEVFDVVPKRQETVTVSVDVKSRGKKKKRAHL